MFSIIIRYTKKNGKIYKKLGKISKKKFCKIPVKVICEIVEGQDYIIEVSKTVNNFVLGNTYLISIDLLEEVTNPIWRNLL